MAERYVAVEEQGRPDSFTYFAWRPVLNFCICWGNVFGDVEDLFKQSSSPELLHCEAFAGCKLATLASGVCCWRTALNVFTSGALKFGWVNSL